MHKQPDKLTLLRYGALGLPLAFAGLPMYVHVPTFYAEHVGLSLSLLGAILLAIRLLDAVVDPLIGALSDRFQRFQRLIFLVAGAVLGGAYVLLFSPPQGQGGGLWLLGCLILVYAAFSTLMINYYALGARLSDDSHGHTRVAAFRESAMLVGVLVASVLPAMLLAGRDMGAAYGLYALCLLPLLAVGLFLLWPLKGAGAAGEQVSFRGLLANGQVRWVLLVGFCNAIPGAITSTLFMFYTADVLKRPQDSGFLLAVYFISAAAGMPLWNWLSRRVGKARCLMLAMGMAILCFIWAWFLEAGQIWEFAVICVLSGLTLGADSMLMPSLLTDAISGQKGAAASAFGLWNLTTKLTMACAAGLVLPVLEVGGYVPGAENPAQALKLLAMCYALLPCLFKAVAVGLLFMSPFFERKRV